MRDRSPGARRIALGCRRPSALHPRARRGAGARDRGRARDPEGARHRRRRPVHRARREAPDLRDEEPGRSSAGSSSRATCACATRTSGTTRTSSAPTAQPKPPALPAAARRQGRDQRVRRRGIPARLRRERPPQQQPNARLRQRLRPRRALHRPGLPRPQGAEGVGRRAQRSPASAARSRTPSSGRAASSTSLWDADINPEGVGVSTWGTPPAENLTLFSNGGLLHRQGERHERVTPTCSASRAARSSWTSRAGRARGARVAYYSWRSLDNGFFTRAATSGSILDGLTDGAPTNAADTLNVGDLAAYLRFERARGLADPRLRPDRARTSTPRTPSQIFGPGSRRTSAGASASRWATRRSRDARRRLLPLRGELLAGAVHRQRPLRRLHQPQGLGLLRSRERSCRTPSSQCTLFVSDEIRDADAGFATSVVGRGPAPAPDGPAW